MLEYKGLFYLFKRIKLPIILSIFLFTLTLSSFSQAQSSYVVTYQLKGFYSTSLVMRIEAYTKHLGYFVLEKSQSWKGDHRPTKQIFCADDGRRLNYNHPETCSLIFWDIKFYREPMAGLGSLTAGDYYFNNNQWLLRESKNFPRIQGISNIGVCINTHNCQPLYPLGKLYSPLFLIWGKNPTITKGAGLTFHFFTDKQGESLDKQAIINNLAPHINYLNKVFISKFGNYIKRPIKIVMLAKDINAWNGWKDNGGVAGDHAFLINYSVKDGKPTANWQQQFNAIALHEYIHILTPCNNFSRWACESLADYYSYKSLTLGNMNVKALLIWNKVKDSNTNYQLGLYTIDQRSRKSTGNGYYQLFYAKGAAFWNELDLLLHKQNYNLDDYINLLTIAPTNYQSQLPSAFTDKMIELLGQQDFNRLANTYLYDTEP